MNLARRIFAWPPVILWALLIANFSREPYSSSWSERLLRYLVALTGIPVSEQALQLANFLLRKTAHVMEFFILGVLLYRAIAEDSRRTNDQVIFGVLVIGTLCAAVSELLQMYSLTRQPSWLDAAVDFAGLLGSQWWIRQRRVLASPTP